MKKIIFSLLTLCGVLSCWAAGDSATIVTNPSPAVSNKPVEITVTTSHLGSDVYCYTWCSSINGQELTPTWSWDGVLTDKFRMTGDAGRYSFTINNIKEFYGLTDDQLAGLTKIGFIVRKSGGGQTQDLFFEVVQGAREAYSGGEGTADSPFILKTANDLKTFAETPGDWEEGCYIKMEADIDATGLTSGIGSESKPFSANFDGNGHSVKNLTLSNNNLGSALGLFGYVKGGSIHNLGVVAANVSGAAYVGILAGYVESGRIECCFTTGDVTGSSICAGGLVGLNNSGVIRNCYSGANVTDAEDYAVGGLVGKNLGTIANTYASGEISGYDYVGGLVGANYGTVSNSVALNKSITSSNDFVARFGGNNNSQNGGTGNLSWNAITPGHRVWTEHGDHAIMKESPDLYNASKFEMLTEWDFNNVWEWAQENTKRYPSLKGLSNQKCILPDLFYQISTAVESVGEGMATISAGPNPTYGELKIYCSEGLAEYRVYSLNGCLIANGDAEGSTEVTLDLGNAPAGMYILRAAGVAGNESILKVIKK